MKAILPLLLFCSVAFAVKAQKIDSIYFHLYTDSLKKGTYNYINVDGKCADGRWLPLTAKEINFTASAGKFEGNSLVIGKDSLPEKIIVKAVLKTDPRIVKETTIWIKTMDDNEHLKTQEEIMKEMQTPKKKNRRG